MSEENISSEVISDSTPIEAASSDSSEIQASEGTLEGSEGQEIATEVEESQPQQTFSLTVDGEDLELTYDQMVEFAQKGKSSVKRFQEAAAMRKEIEAERAAIQAAIQGKPEDLFNMKIQNGLMTGEDLEKWIIEKAIAIAERPELTPEQQRMMDMERELEELRRAKEEQENQRRTAAFEAQKEQYREQFSRDIMSAIEDGGLEADPYTIQRVALTLQNHIDETGNLRVSVRDVVDHIKHEERNLFNDYLSNLELDRIEKLLGEDKLKKIRAKDLEKLKNPVAKPTSKVEDVLNKPKAKPASMSEFFKNLNA